MKIVPFYWGHGTEAGCRWARRLEQDLVLGRPAEGLVREDDARADVDLGEDVDVLG